MQKLCCALQSAKTHTSKVNEAMGTFHIESVKSYCTAKLVEHRRDNKREMCVVLPSDDRQENNLSIEVQAAMAGP